MVTVARLHDEIDEMLPGLVADRRFLHENPELGFQEHNTARFVADRLAALGVEDIRTGINQTGVTGLVRGIAAGPQRVVLVRADMDALPILEENQVEYVSRNPGVMHACGHDAHTTILLGLARILTGRRDRFSGTVKLLFQPSEEMFPGGAKGMIEEGVMEDPHVDASFALHMANHKPLGVITIAPGPILAAPDSFQVTIKGKGGHAASPHRAVDPIVTGAMIVNALQTIVSRNVDPVESCVVTVGAFNAGEAFNVIPDTARIGGTVRTLTPDLRDLAQDRVKSIIESVATAMGATVDIEYTRGYPATINDAGAAALIREVATDIVGAENVVTNPPSMGGEDYAYFLLDRPGAMFQVGSKNEEKGLVWGHHHPRFDIDEDSLAIGLEVMTGTVLAYLERGFDTQPN